MSESVTEGASIRKERGGKGRGRERERERGGGEGRGRGGRGEGRGEGGEQRKMMVRGREECVSQWGRKQKGEIESELVDDC